MAGTVLASVEGFKAPSGSIFFQVREGDLIRITGPNGSGKTSLLRCMAGLPSAIPCDVAREVPVSFAMQDARDGLIGLTVAGEFRLRQIPADASLANLADRDVAFLSSGEARRVAIGVLDAPIWLLDEPDEGLDEAAQAELVLHLLEHRQRGAVVVVDHGNLLAQIATATIQLGSTTQTSDSDVQWPHVTAITGPNGSGKTTRLRQLLTEVEGARMLPAPARDLVHGDTVGTVLSRADAETVAVLVPAALMGRHPVTLSGGEMQRVALALVLGFPAPSYLLDEPEAHLDDAGRTTLSQLITTMVQSGAKIHIATHLPMLIRRAGTEVVVP